MSKIQEVPEQLPCGCRVAKRIVDGERQLAYQPCSMTCEFFLHAVSESKRLGMPVDEEIGEL